MLTYYIPCTLWDVFSCTSVLASHFPYIRKTAFNNEKIITTKNEEYEARDSNTINVLKNNFVFRIKKKLLL